MGACRCFQGPVSLEKVQHLLQTILCWMMKFCKKVQKTYNSTSYDKSAYFDSLSKRTAAKSIGFHKLTNSVEFIRKILFCVFDCHIASKYFFFFSTMSGIMWKYKIFPLFCSIFCRKISANSKKNCICTVCHFFQV